jgi:hypothetical protein
MNMFTPTTSPIDDEFLLKFKHQTESRWEHEDINPGIYGFQFQRGTRWNRGLTEADIEMYQTDLGVQFPTDFKHMLRLMNGTDLPTVNIYASSGEPQRTSVGVYSYPRDLSIVQELRRGTERDRDEIAAELLDQGFKLESNANLVPIFSHRYIICGTDPGRSIVLSIVGADAILYGDSLRTYLQAEFLLN